MQRRPHYSTKRDEEVSQIKVNRIREGGISYSTRSDASEHQLRNDFISTNRESQNKYSQRDAEAISRSKRFYAERARIEAERRQQYQTNRQSSQSSRPGTRSTARTERRYASRPETRPQSRVAPRTNSRPASHYSSQRRRKKKNILPFVIIAALAVIGIVALILIFANAKISEPLNVKISSTENSQTITWKRKGKSISFEVQQKGPDGAYSIVKTIPEDGSTTYTAQALKSATEYSYKITSIKGNGDHAKRSEGVEISAYTIPVSVSNLSASTESKDSLTFAWNDSQTLSGYELKYSLNEDLSESTNLNIPFADVSKTEGSDLRYYTVPNLPEGNTYYYQFRSKCGENVYSAWTPTASAKVTRAVDMTGIDIHAPMVAITYDDGPDGSNITTRILDAFASVGGHATFFQLGNLAENNPDKIQRMVAEGHEVGNHTYDHTHMSETVTAEDIINCSNSIEAICGVRPTVFRSTGGGTTDYIKQVCAGEGMSLYYWSVDTRDWKTRDSDAIVSHIQNNVSDGDIILMHNIYDSTAEATERIVPWLVQQGYQLVTVSQLIKAKTGELPVAGTEYITADRVR